MRLEPMVPELVASGRLHVDFDTGLIYSARSNTPEKPLGALTAKGYVRICLSVDGNQAHALAHRVVWTAKHGEIPAWAQIDHIDTVKTNNSLGNLESVSGAENMVRAARNGLTNGGWKSGPRNPANGQPHPRIIDRDQIATRPAHIRHAIPGHRRAAP